VLHDQAARDGLAMTKLRSPAHAEAPGHVNPTGFERHAPAADDQAPRRRSGFRDGGRDKRAGICAKTNAYEQRGG